jgi:hypothetical protein
MNKENFCRAKIISTTNRQNLSKMPQTDVFLIQSKTFSNKIKIILLIAEFIAPESSYKNTELTYHVITLWRYKLIIIIL